MEAGPRFRLVTLEDCGPVSVLLQGEDRHLKDGVVFLTVHDVGSSYKTWFNFLADPSMEDIRSRAMVVHVAVPGQEPGAPDLPRDFRFPSMAQLGLGLVTILDHLRVKSVVGLGDGAGANIITRFSMLHPGRVLGMVGVNTSAWGGADIPVMDLIKAKVTSLKKDQEGDLNEKNVARYAEAYRRRSEIMPELNKRIKTDILLLTGTRSKVAGDTEAIHREMLPGLCSIIKVEDVSAPLAEAPEKVAEAVLLFCQGLGLMPTAQRRGSRQGCEDLPRKITMTMAEWDLPTRKFSLDLDG